MLPVTCYMCLLLSSLRSQRSLRSWFSLSQHKFTMCWDSSVPSSSKPSHSYRNCGHWKYPGMKKCLRRLCNAGSSGQVNYPWSPNILSLGGPSAMLPRSSAQPFTDSTWHMERWFTYAALMRTDPFLKHSLWPRLVSVHLKSPQFQSLNSRQLLC